MSQVPRRPAIGETIARVVLAVQVLLLDGLGKGAGAGHLTVGYLAGTGLPALACAAAGTACDPGLTTWLYWVGQTLRDPPVWRDLALLTIFSTVLATHWLVIYQPRVPANRAAVIYLLESVFAAAFSILWGHDRVTLPLALGGVLIVTGVLLVELAPAAPCAAAGATGAAAPDTNFGHARIGRDHRSDFGA